MTSTVSSSIQSTRSMKPRTSKADRQPELLLDGEDVAVVDDALLGDEAPEDGEPLGEDVHAGEPLGAPRLAVELDGALLGQRARALVVDDLLMRRSRTAWMVLPKRSGSPGSACFFSM